MKCHYCNETSDLRPYGPNGAMVCFDCAMATPEREKEAERQFAIQLNGSGPVAVLDGTCVDPYPAKHNPELMKIIEATTSGQRYEQWRNGRKRMNLDYTVPEDWSEESKALFARIYRHASENQEIFTHPKSELLPREQWNTICWNLAWMATDCAAGCGGFIHLNDKGETVAVEITKEMLQ